MSDLPLEFNAAPSRTELDLHHGDCVAGMRELAADSVDVVVTSPPYNLDISYGKYRDDANRADYLAWSMEWATEVRRVLRDTGSFFLNVGASPKNPLLPHQLALKFSELFVLQNTFHWTKSITVTPKDGPAVSAGHFKPINSKRFVTDCHEYVFHFTANGDVPLDRLAIGVEYVHKSNINRWGHTDGQDKRCRGNMWFVPYKTIRSRKDQRPHPATFPTQLAEWCIRIHGEPHHRVVMDPFLGIGHSASAALNCDVAKFIGFEIDEDYLAEAGQRLANMPPSPATD